MKPTSTIGAGCLVTKDEHVLLVKPNYGKAKNSWILPGGFIEAGEDLAQGALRELFEETGQEGRIERPFCVRYRLEPSDIYWVFRASLKEMKPILVQSEELLDVQFVPLKEAMSRPDVRPMTRYFLESSISKRPHDIRIPEEFASNNLVYFFSEPQL
jgi:8-oxo-dGTP diphosphatase